ncbi:hypothetical protein GCM10009767_28000 [Kocuria aegyptia]|uniref:Uncharacterized protein n=1 Tax=Kocuria aegyptia TaxID=330943 RepID=A0ABP4X1M2_9MICC
MKDPFRKTDNGGLTTRADEKKHPVLESTRKLCNTIRDVRFRVSHVIASVKGSRQYDTGNLQYVAL